MATSNTDLAFESGIESMVDGPVASPCIRICTLDDDDVCLGCYRNMDEICAWGLASEDERRQILRAVELRRNAYPQRA